MDRIELNQFPNVAANAPATLVTDELVGKSLHAIVLERGGTAFTNAHIGNVEVRVDGVDIVEGISGDQLVALNLYDGLPDVTNYTVIYFGDPTARTIRGQHLGNIDFSIYPKPLEIKIDIGAATAPELQAYALTGVPKLDMGIGFNEVEAARMRALLRTVIQPSAAIKRKTYGLTLGSRAGVRLRRAAFFHANLTSVELKKSSLMKFDDISNALNNAIAQQYARAPQAGLYVMDSVVDGNQGEAETTVDGDGKPWNMQLALTTSAGDTITAFSDVHGLLEQL